MSFFPQFIPGLFPVSPDWISLWRLCSLLRCSLFRPCDVCVNTLIVFWVNYKLICRLALALLWLWSCQATGNDVTLKLWAHGSLVAWREKVNRLQVRYNNRFIKGGILIMFTLMLTGRILSVKLPFWSHNCNSSAPAWKFTGLSSYQPRLSQ